MFPKKRLTWPGSKIAWVKKLLTDPLSLEHLGNSQRGEMSGSCILTLCQKHKLLCKQTCHCNARSINHVRNKAHSHSSFGRPLKVPLVMLAMLLYETLLFAARSLINVLAVNIRGSKRHC
jgi:hypothetical protein